MNGTSIPLGAGKLHRRSPGRYWLAYTVATQVLTAHLPEQDNRPISYQIGKKIKKTKKKIKNKKDTAADFTAQELEECSSHECR